MPTEPYWKQVCYLEYKGDVIAAKALRGRNGSIYRSKLYINYLATLRNLILQKTKGDLCDPYYVYKVEAIINWQSRTRGDNGGDIDNFLKPIMDAGTGIIYKDDRQVSEIHIKLNRGCVDPGFDVTFYRSSETTYNVFICEQCNKPYRSNLRLELNRKRTGETERHFCSSKCYAKFKSANKELYPTIYRKNDGKKRNLNGRRRTVEYINTPCVYCGKIINHRITKPRKFCSIYCYKLYQNENPVNHFKKGE